MVFPTPLLAILSLFLLSIIFTTTTVAFPTLSIRNSALTPHVLGERNLAYDDLKLIAVLTTAVILLVLGLIAAFVAHGRRFNNLMQRVYELEGGELQRRDRSGTESK